MARTKGIRITYDTYKKLRDAYPAKDEETTAEWFDRVLEQLKKGFWRVSLWK